MAQQVENSLNLIFDGEPEAPEVSGSADSWVLDLADLIADAQGEVVITETAGAHLTITASTAVASTGHAEAHMTEAGIDVEGFNFVRFDNGITLYFEDGVDLSLLAQQSSAG